MKKAMLKRWIADLRSGRYRQGGGCLLSDDGTYCCLGVLANAEVDGYWVRDDCGEWDLEFGNGLSESVYLIRLSTDLGLPSSVQGYLVGLNDEEGFTFPQIADWLEAWDKAGQPTDSLMRIKP